MMQRFITLIFLALAFYGFSQNTPRFSQFNFAQGINNPAALAIDGEIMVDMMIRNQWFGVKGAPTTGAINAQYELYHDMAAGLTVSYDLIGVHHSTQVAGQYAYRAYTRAGNAFIFGASIGVDQRVHDLASAQLTHADDPVFSTTYSKLNFQAGFGMFYNAPRFYAGLSIPQLFQNTLRGPESSFAIKRWHYYASTGFYAEVNENYTLNPHLQVKAAINAPIQADIIFRNTFYNTWSLVLGYRTENSLIAGLDVRIGGNYRMGYSFNYDVGKLARAKGSSHEVYVGFAFPYHNSRESFSKRKYINRKGRHRRDFHKGYKHRKWYK